MSSDANPPAVSTGTQSIPTEEGTGGGNNVSSITVDSNNKKIVPPTKKHIPRHLRGKPRRKKLLGPRTFADGYENSGHETSDFLFTEDDQSALEEEDMNRENIKAKGANQTLIGKIPKNSGKEYKEQPQNHHQFNGATVTADVCDAISTLAVSTDLAEHVEDKKGIESSDNINHTSIDTASDPLWASPQQELSQRSPKTAKDNNPKKSSRTQNAAPITHSELVSENNPADLQNKDGCVGFSALGNNTGQGPQQHQDPQEQHESQEQQKQVKQRSSRKRSKRKSNRNARDKPTQLSCSVCYEADHDPHEDEDDYPSNLAPIPPLAPNTREENTEEDFTSSKQTKAEQPKRTLEEELSFLTRVSPTKYIVKLGFVPNMKVPAEIIVNEDLQTLLVQELHDTCCGPKSDAGSSFIPALRQAANVAALPGIVKASLAMPDVHSGYGFCIGNVAAFDMNDPNAVISPGGVGFDINCGVRLIRTNLTEKDVDEKVREELAEAMFRNIPVGVGVDGGIPCSNDDLDKLLKTGIDWAIDKGYAWEEDKLHCEENGRMETADPNCVSRRAKKRGLKQLGTLGAGNHYAEIQVVEEIYHSEAANAMGIGKIGQVCIMIHTGSRGLGHQVATDALTEMERAMARDHIDLNDRQLSCARINSREGKSYLGERVLLKILLQCPTLSHLHFMTTMTFRLTTSPSCNVGGC
eukprot:CCRYP_009688-RB/>CCRYP_009688-RB protein AED:0.00 eAED:0.00 QI:532/1/1/1/1/1/2/1002/695